MKITLEVVKSARDAIEELRKSMGADSFVDVVRHSLDLMQYAQNCRLIGGTLIMRYPDGKEVIVGLPQDAAGR